MTEMPPGEIAEMRAMGQAVAARLINARKKAVVRRAHHRAKPAHQEQLGALAERHQTD